MTGIHNPALTSWYIPDRKIPNNYITLDLKSDIDILDDCTKFASKFKESNTKMNNIISSIFIDMTGIYDITTFSLFDNLYFLNKIE